MAKKILYATNLKKAAQVVERAIQGLAGVTYHITLTSYWEPENEHSPKQWEVIHVDLWFFRHFCKRVQASNDLEWLEKEVKRVATETMAQMRNYFAPKEGLPYEALKSILKGAGLPAAGDPCIAPPGKNGKKCSGKIEWDPVMRRHRCGKCAYGF